MATAVKWLLLLYGLPTKSGAERVSLWRRLKKLGALALKTSAYLLPDNPENAERFQWLAQAVRDGGGEATLIRVSEVEGLSNESTAQLFNENSAKEYDELIREASGLIERNKRKMAATFAGELEKLSGRLEE